MIQTRMDLDSDLITIMSALEFNKFTVLELRSAYIAISKNKPLHKTEARRFVYRHILRLEKKGLLKRIDSKTTKITTYVKTDLFHTVNFISKDCASHSEKASNVSSQTAVKELVDRLQRYNAELPSLIGEASEYKSLYAEYPQLKGLQNNYNLARNKIRNIEGLITAVEKTIKDQNILEGNNETS